MFLSIFAHIIKHVHVNVLYETYLNQCDRKEKGFYLSSHYWTENYMFFNLILFTNFLLFLINLFYFYYDTNHTRGRSFSWFSLPRILHVVDMEKFIREFSDRIKTLFYYIFWYLSYHLLNNHTPQNNHNIQQHLVHVFPFIVFHV